MPLPEILWLLILGLLAGSLGGMLGLGGSMIMIPVLTLLLGKDQHVSQAVAMIVNVFIAVPSLMYHARMGAVDREVLKKMLPAGIVLMLVGVAVSNQFDGETLRRVFGLFLVYVVGYTLVKAVTHNKAIASPRRVTGPRTGGIGGLMGFLGGFLGIGGGVVTVPLLQRLCGVPLRVAIGTSSAVMVYTALIGATHKTGSLVMNPAIAGGESNDILMDILIIAAVLVPSGIVGSYFGARMTHTLPIWVVQAVFALLMAWAAVMMLV